MAIKVSARDARFELSCLSCNTRDGSELRRFDVVNDLTGQQVWGGCICATCLLAIRVPSRAP